jgi:hypothetical protein
MAFIRNGFSTLITFAALDFGPANIVEKTVTSPGVEGGGPINITNMRNLRFRTAVPKSLLTVKNLTLTVQWDPVWYDLVILNMQVVDLTSIIYPDASALEFYAWVDDISPQENREGEEPLANMVVIPGLWYNDAEEPPVYTAPP